MNACNLYGQFTDSPVEKQWWCRFDVLWIRRDHRKILNRQPELKIKRYLNIFGYTIIIKTNGEISLKDGENITFSNWNIDWKVINN